MKAAAKLADERDAAVTALAAVLPEFAPRIDYAALRAAQYTVGDDTDLDALRAPRCVRIGHRHGHHRPARWQAEDPRPLAHRHHLEGVMKHTIGTITGAAVLVLVLAGTAFAQSRPPYGPTTGSPAWLIPQGLATAFTAAGGETPPITPTNRTFRSGVDDINGGRVLSGPGEQVIQFASLAALRSEIAAGTLPPGTKVLYDMEGWSDTPHAEYAKPYKSLRQFVSVARAAGLIAGLCPHGSLRERASKIDADFYLAQMQGQGMRDRGKTYGDVAKDLAANMHPGEALICELSTGHAPNADMLYAQWKAALPYASGFSLWGADATNSPAQMAMGVEFLAMVSGEDGL